MMTVAAARRAATAFAVSASATVENCANLARLTSSPDVVR